MTSESSFGMSMDHQGDVTIIVLSGRVDAHIAPDLLNSFEDIIDGDSAKIVVDMSKVSFISSFGLGVLSSCLKSAKEKGGDIKLSAIPTGILLPFEVTGLLPRFSVFADTADAVSAFASKD